MPFKQTTNTTTIPASYIPDKVWEIMASLKAGEFNVKLGEKYKLGPEKIHLLAQIEGEVFYKELPLQKFPETLQEKLNLDPETTQKLANDVNKELFAPLQDYLGISTPFPMIEEVEEKPKKPSPFKKLFKKKPEKSKPEKTKPKPEIPAPPKKPAFFKGKISPYEQRRGVPPEIPTFSKELEKTSQRLARLKQKKAEAPLKKVDVGEYKIRTMKQDVEKAKKQVIPQKPRPEADQPQAGKPKLKNNIVDLSGK
jgi:hypothetical protein